ncbi:MAG: hypothetical protein E7260_10700 [Lachnospiraceae bacterium]|nr:hypothetical protein [Lachnospiraceae bacterium]
MRQIYNFEQTNPPVLNESMLRAELEKRKLKKQTTLIAICGILSMLLLLVFAVLLTETQPLLATLCMAYVIISLTGSVVLAILMHSGHGRLIQQNAA